MGKNYYTAKEIIMGLRNDYRIRNNILTEIKYRLMPLNKKMSIDVLFDDDSQTVELEASYKKPNLFQMCRYLFGKKYTYTAFLRKNDNNVFMFDESLASNPKSIFPIEFDMELYIQLERLYNELLRDYYKVSNCSDKIFSYYNSLVMYDNNQGLDYNIVCYNPYGDKIDIGSSTEITNRDVTEILSREYPKELLSKEAQYKIDNNPSSFKSIRLISEGADKEVSFGIREREDEIILVKKLVK